MLTLAKTATAQMTAVSAFTDFMFVLLLTYDLFVGPVCLSHFHLKRLSPGSENAITGGLYPSGLKWQ